MKVKALIFFILLAIPRQGSACDACSCSASNLSQWTELGTARSMLSWNSQYLRWKVNGYALADSIQTQSLALQTMTLQYAVNAKWTVLGSLSASQTTWQYPNTHEQQWGVGNGFLGGRFTQYRPIASRNFYYGATAQIFFPTGARPADPLNLSQTPWGTGGNLFSRLQWGKFQHLAVLSFRYHFPRQKVQLGRSTQVQYTVAYTAWEKMERKIQLISGASHYRQRPDIENTTTGGLNPYSGGNFTTVQFGLGAMNQKGGLTLSAQLPVRQHLGNGTSELHPFLRGSVKVYLGS